MAKSQTTDTRVFVAITTGTALVAGERIALTKGQTYVLSGHPILAQCPTYFAPLGDLLEWAPKSRAPDPTL